MNLRHPRHLRLKNQTDKLSFFFLRIPNSEPYGSHHQCQQSNIGRPSRRQSEAFWSHTNISGANGCHKHGGDERDIEDLPAFGTHQIDRHRPQGEDGQGLVGPSEVTPNHVKALGIAQAIEQQAYRRQKHRHADIQAFADGLLLQPQEICHNEAGRTESRVATGDGSGNHAQHGQYTTHRTEPVLGNGIDDDRGIRLFHPILVKEIGGGPSVIIAP